MCYQAPTFLSKSGINLFVFGNIRAMDKAGPGRVHCIEEFIDSKLTESNFNSNDNGVLIVDIL